jgi:hypothetical protein
MLWVSIVEHSREIIMGRGGFLQGQEGRSKPEEGYLGCSEKQWGKRAEIEWGLVPCFGRYL